LIKKTQKIFTKIVKLFSKNSQKIMSENCFKKLQNKSKVKFNLINLKVWIIWVFKIRPLALKIFFLKFPFFKGVDTERTYILAQNVLSEAMGYYCCNNR